MKPSRTTVIGGYVNRLEHLAMSPISINCGENRQIIR